MSLPTQAIFIKDNEAVGQCFVNCGWTYDEVSSLKQVADYLKRNPLEYDYFRVYNENYSFNLKEIAEYIILIDEENERIRKEYKAKIQEYYKTREELGIDSPVIGMIRRTIPSVIAEEILSVQPMNII